MYRYLIIIVAILTISCNQVAETSESQDTTEFDAVTLSYATGFSIESYNDFKKVTVHKPFMNSKSGFEYFLTENLDAIPEHLKNKKWIKIPVENIVCTSTTHIPFLDYLDESNSLVGFPTTDYISSKKMRARIDTGEVTELGIDKEMNLEKLVELDPDMIMAYTISGDLGQFDKIEQLGISTVINAEYLEEHPLGRAEWIKFVAAFFNKEEVADSVFKMIESNYVKYNKIARVKDGNPSVLSGIVYGDTWYLPGGKNYAARLLQDAGGDYLWSQDSTRGFLELSFEAVYEKAHEADYWIGVASFETLNSILQADARYGDFKAFKEKNVYTNNWRKGAKGGSEFLELGYLRPDIILADLIKILHPNTLPQHELYFHKKLE